MKNNVKQFSFYTQDGQKTVSKFFFNCKYSNWKFCLFQLFAHLLYLKIKCWFYVHTYKCKTIQVPTFPFKCWLLLKTNKKFLLE